MEKSIDTLILVGREIRHRYVMTEIILSTGNIQIYGIKKTHTTLQVIHWEIFDGWACNSWIVVFKYSHIKHTLVFSILQEKYSQRPQLLLTHLRVLRLGNVDECFGSRMYDVQLLHDGGSVIADSGLTLELWAWYYSARIIHVLYLCTLI